MNSWKYKMKENTGNILEELEEIEKLQEINENTIDDAITISAILTIACC